ncbi:MAG TPA: patatin-like phospholipase family protein [Legionella sp.]|nr:patatin-like phospholipase family protein [Legionella sp.]
MTPTHVISQLLKSDTKYSGNLNLLKKIIFTVYLGRLQINGTSPDINVPLGNYLFDDERIIFDFTRLSDVKKNLYLEWLLQPHENEKKKTYFSSAYINEYRGFTAEVGLSFWGRIQNRILGRSSDQWKISDLGLSVHYQLTGIELCHGQQGVLIGFNQYLVPDTGSKYKDPNDAQSEPLGNTKRVFITNKMVDTLLTRKIKNLNFEDICKSHHPLSTHITDIRARFKDMNDYRQMQKFINIDSWYLKLWQWIKSWFTSHKNTPGTLAKLDNNLSLIHQEKDIKIYRRSGTEEILVQETRPDIKNFVLCGGGAKIFAHVGVWRALNEANIKPEKFAGSSAGAIMALLCYLGYTSTEIIDFFKHFKQEHLVLFNIDRNGLSDTHALKTALDYAIAYKIKEIVSQYKVAYPLGKITFASLEALRKECPDCGLGQQLIVTATNKNSRKTIYFSLEKSPNMEVSEAVKISASFPVLYRNTVVEGEGHTDGGVLNNFPTDAFSDDHSTLLESEYGNNLQLLAVQFDNGTERNTIDRVMEKVYRENFALNWFYSLLTGVKDPASAWEQDRMKLRKYASQSIVIDVGDASTMGFSIEETKQQQLIQCGYDATKEYLDLRYSTCSNKYTNKELMYSSFNSLADLLAYCCYRDNKHWFDLVFKLILHSNIPHKATLIKQSYELKSIYFNQDLTGNYSETSANPLTFFGNDIINIPSIDKNRSIELLALYPIFLKLTIDLFRSKADYKILESAHHSLNIYNPFACLEHFAKITGEHHVILSIIINLIKELKEGENETIYETLLEVKNMLYSDSPVFKGDCNGYFGKWDLTVNQSHRVWKLLNNQKYDEALQLLKCLKRHSEPLQILMEGQFSEESLNHSFDYSVGANTLS